MFGVRLQFTNANIERRTSNLEVEANLEAGPHPGYRERG
jgi:hypothetical protein